MTDWISGIIESIGYPAIIALMFVENVFPPIPSELIMPFAGYMVAKGTFSFVGVVISGATGSVLGALPLYFLGRLASRQQLKSWTQRYGRWATITERDVEKAMSWFNAHGATAVFLCRLVPGVRSLISIPAGSAGMSMSVFLTYTALGTGLWSLLLTALGWWLSAQYQKVSSYLSPATYIVLTAIAITVIGWIVRRKRNLRRQST